MFENDEDMLLMLLIKGISVRNEDYFYDDLRNALTRRFKRFDYYYKGYRYSTYMESRDKTPFLYSDGSIYYNGHLLNNLHITRIESSIWGSEQSWYIKTWNSNNLMPFELRLNPINTCYNLKYRTGENKEFRGCAFCHRVYTHTRKSENRRLVNIEDIFNEIFEVEGCDILNKLKKVLIMTGNAKNTQELLKLCEDVHNILCTHTYKGIFSVSTNQIFSKLSIQRLAKMDSSIFDYTLEVFDRRNILMGNEKGYDMETVRSALSIARDYFQNIRITYIVGLDDLETIKRGFVELKESHLIDDIVPLVFVPYTPEMKMLRCHEAQTLDYYHAVQNIFKELSLIPLKNGLSKNLFPEHDLNNKIMDSLLECK